VQVDKDNNSIQNLGLPTTIGESKQIKNDDDVVETIYYFPASSETA
jgi:hypothetical protein